MSETVAMQLSMIVDQSQKGGHQNYRVEARMNTGLEEHLKVCVECRETLASDLHTFAKQILTMGPRT